MKAWISILYSKLAPLTRDVTYSKLQRQRIIEVVSFCQTNTLFFGLKTLEVLNKRVFLLK